MVAEQRDLGPGGGPNCGLERWVSLNAIVRQSCQET